MDIKTIKLTDVTIHDLANSNPSMSDAEFNALQLDIAANTQLDPVTVYRGKIVDGRHRYKALTNLGLDTIIADILPNNTTLEKVRKLVMSKEIRRHQSATQKAIKAFRLVQMGTSNVDAVKCVGCSKTNLRYAIALGKLKRFDLIDRLEAGYKIKNTNGKLTDSLLAVLNLAKSASAETEEDNRAYNEAEMNDTLDPIIDDDGNILPPKKEKMSKPKYDQMIAIQLLIEQLDPDQARGCLISAQKVISGD